MRAAATALAFSLAASGCDNGSPASPAFQSTAGQAEAGAVQMEAGFAVCPPDVDASFGSIYTQILSTPSCGTNNPLTCHSSSGSLSAGSLLDLSLDAGAVTVYAELLGADGGGHRSTNEDHPDVFVPRVVPFDAGASMLYIKLTISSPNDPQYGSGMPLTAPGSVCPATLQAVADWINSGAIFVPGSLDGGPEDAATDADAGPGTDATLD
jgi:hypothetical protein